MVDSKEQTREAILGLITHVCSMEWFERKQEVVNALYNIEWSLRPKDMKIEKIEDIPEEFENGHEEGWNT